EVGLGDLLLGGLVVLLGLLPKERHVLFGYLLESFDAVEVEGDGVQTIAHGASLVNDPEPFRLVAAGGGLGGGHVVHARPGIRGAELPQKTRKTLRGRLGLDGDRAVRLVPRPAAGGGREAAGLAERAEPHALDATAEDPPLSDDAAHALGV